MISLGHASSRSFCASGFGYRPTDLLDDLSNALSCESMGLRDGVERLSFSIPPNEFRVPFLTIH